MGFQFAEMDPVSAQKQIVVKPGLRGTRAARAAQSVQLARTMSNVVRQTRIVLGCLTTSIARMRQQMFTKQMDIFAVPMERRLFRKRMGLSAAPMIFRT